MLGWKQKICTNIHSSKQVSLDLGDLSYTMNNKAQRFAQNLIVNNP